MLERVFKVRVKTVFRCACGGNEFEVTDADDSDGFSFFVGKCAKCGREYVITPSMILDE